MERRGKYVAALRWIMLVGLIAILCLAGVVIAAMRHQRSLQFVVVEDDTGRELRFLASPRRIVALDRAAASLLKRLGREGLLIAASEELSYEYPWVENLGFVAGVTAERIIGLRSDLVLLGGEQAALADTLRVVGINAFVLRPTTLAQLLSAPERLGLIVQADDDALMLQRELDEQLNQVSLPLENPPGVFLLAGPDLLAAGEGTLAHDLIELVGGRNLAAHLTGWSECSLEEMAAAQPDLIIAPDDRIDELIIDYFRILPSQIPEGGRRMPRFVILPDDFLDISWENIVARARELRTRITAITPDIQEP
ncbi:MAG: ABC transporter substrate-binding protein [Bacillota bacterium]